MPFTHSLETEELVIDLFVNKKLTVRQILDEVKIVSKPYVNRLIKHKNLRPEKSRVVVTETLEKKVCEMYQTSDNNTGLLIAKHFNMSPGTLYNILKKHNIRLKMNNPTEEHQKEICNAYSNTNLTIAEIATNFKSSKQLIGNILEKNNIEQRNKIISTQRASTLLNCDESFFEKPNNEKVCWVLGFICGDGFISSGEKTIYTININIQRADIEVLEKIKEYMKSEHAIGHSNQLLKSGKIYNNVSLVISRKKLWQDIINLGITHEKSRELTIPKMNDELICHFIRGVVCSDGGFHINKHNTISFSIASSVYSFLEEVRIILMNKCDLEMIKIINSGGCYHLKYMGNSIVRKIFNYLYPNPENKVFLERKYNYVKRHFNNLDHGIISRNPNDPPLNQYTFGTEDDYSEIKPEPEIKIEPKPRTQLEMLLGLNQ